MQPKITSFKIDKNQLGLELSSIEPTVKEEATNYVRKNIFVPAVRETIQEFEKHVVTQELDNGSTQGNSAGNPSKTISVGNSQKNLFTFIGFNEGERPTNAIRNRLREGSFAGPKMRILPVKKRRFEYEFEIAGPDIDAIYEATPLPWASSFSWAERLERGIEGLSRFIAKDGIKTSRSGGGIQGGEIEGRQRKSSPIKYLSTIVNNFLTRIRRA